MATHDEFGVLSAAIDKADLPALRSVLKSMCESSATCRMEAAQRLLLSDADSSSSKKPKIVSRYETCITCKEVFDVTTNRDDSCQTHSDYLEIDEDVFPDDDQIAAGDVDPYTDWRREEWPQGFIWQCCDRHIKETPCVIQRHISAQGLLLPASGGGDNKKRKSENDAEDDIGGSSKKAKTVRSRYETCITCEKVFDVTDNQRDSCQTHPDIVQIDHDFFPDDDEVAYGDVDPETDWRREEVPEGFIYECCGRNLKQKPCVIQKHLAEGDEASSSSEGTDEESPIEISSDEDEDEE